MLMRPQIAVYYFPNYHIDPQNEKWHGKGWTEWNLVKTATPRFPGHAQPKVPAWGYEDEADPSVMARKIDAAADHGIDTFLFDWYWYNNAPYLHRALEEGFIPAHNSNRLKFALMWANHDWLDIHPAQRSRPCNVLAKGAVTLEQFVDATNYIIETYFTRPNYWRVNDGLYFSVYELMGLIQGLGGLEQTKAALEDFRRRVAKAGLGKLHLNAVVWGLQLLPGEKSIEKPEQLVPALGLDSVTSYVWIHHQALKDFPETDYAAYAEANFADFSKFTEKYNVPYFPNVTMGWDSSPRTIQSDVFENTGYPAMPILKNNTPAEFQKALLAAKEFLLQGKTNPPILTINAWNEWTEGSYLEPDTVHQMGYLEAIKAVFGS
jgi:hypothetical protein